MYVVKITNKYVDMKSEVILQCQTDNI